MRKKNALSVVRSRGTLTIVELHSLAREAALTATNREAEDLGRALELIQEAEQLARAVTASTANTLAATETRAAAVGLVGACEHLRAAITTLGSAP